jgi:hypothetical protein
MGVTLLHLDNNVRVLRIAGVLKKSEFDEVINAEAAQWGPRTRVKVLVVAEGFQGWEGTEEWGDITFFMKYGDQVDKIAIVADPKWETDLLMFSAEGLRRGPVKFFRLEQMAFARAWLEE